MELKKYNYIIATLSDWDKAGKAYWFTVEWESIDEPGAMKNFTGNSRETGLAKFNDIIEKVSSFPNCLSIHFVAYSGKTGSKILLQETISTNDRNFYPVQQVSTPKEVKTNVAQPQSNQFAGLEFMGAILGDLNPNGENSLQGVPGAPQILGTLLAFRDERIETKHQKQDLEKELNNLKEAKTILQSKLDEANSRIDELEGENDNLSGEIENLTVSNQALQKYVPANSTLGLSLSAIGSAALEGFVKRIVYRNPQAVANLLGTDLGTLNGLFENSAEPTRQIIQPEAVSVELSGEDENQSPARKAEIDVINAMVAWLKGLDTKHLAMVQRLMNTWSKDIETLEMEFDWATGSKQS